MPVKEAVDFPYSMYLDFAIPAFRLTHSGVKPETDASLRNMVAAAKEIRQK